MELQETRDPELREKLLRLLGDVAAAVLTRHDLLLINLSLGLPTIEIVAPPEV